MSIARPTFSDSWHRVAELRPRLRAAVQTSRQQYRGRTWHVLTDPANNQYFRLDDAGYHFVALLDGRRTVAQAWNICNEQHGDAAPTQGEVIQILGQLYTSNLLQADLPPDASGMFDLHRRRRRREISSMLMNFLFVKIPLIDPHRFLQLWVPVVGWVFSPLGLVLWLGVIAAGLYHLAGREEELLSSAMPQVMLDGENMLLLYAAFAIIKAIHELGHGFACAYFGRRNGAGGEVHTMGIMLLVLMPVPYVDASSSWLFRSKWQRAIVGAAGMYVELAVAAIAAVIWARTGDDTLIHALAYNMMFIASVSTILFNANPLLRFDGYYILSDLLELPNLAERSRRYVLYLIRRYTFGVRHQPNPAHTTAERIWFVFYAIASTIYRILISIGIILYVSGMLFIIGLLMALAAVATWLVVPVWKSIKYLFTSPELERTRGRALLVSGAFATAVFILVGLVPFPDRGRAEGVVEPVRLVEVYTAADGFVDDVLESGVTVQPTGKPLLTAHNQELLSRQRELQARVRGLEVRRDLARREDPAAVQAFNEQIAALRENSSYVQAQLEGLTIQPPFAGIWFRPQTQHIRGVYLKQGTSVGVVADPTELIIRVTADQSLGPRIGPEIGSGPDALVEVRGRNRPDVEVAGTIERVLPAGQSRLPSAALGYAAGGTMETDLQDPQGTKSAEPFFEVHIRPLPAGDGEPPAKPLHIGQRVVVRFTMEPKPLAVQGWRSLRQLFQQRFAIQM